MTPNDYDELSGDAGEFVFGDDGARATTEGSDGLLGRVSQRLDSRRSFMGNAAKVGAGALALGAVGSGSAAAAHADTSYSDSAYEDANEFGYGALTDVEIVRFALLLERLEATFYTDAVGTGPVDATAGDAGGRLTQNEIERSPVAMQFANPSMQYVIFQRFRAIRNHEQAHVDALSGVLSEVGGNPNFAADVSFTFPYDSFGGFLDLARVFEDTGAKAYTGAAPAIDTEEYLAAAARIHGIEHRHASYIRTINNPLSDDGGSLTPFPLAFAERLSVTAVAKRVVPFVKGVDEASQVLSLVTKD